MSSRRRLPLVVAVPVVLLTGTALAGLGLAAGAVAAGPSPLPTFDVPTEPTSAPTTSKVQPTRAPTPAPSTSRPSSSPSVTSTRPTTSAAGSSSTPTTVDFADVRHRLRQLGLLGEDESSSAATTEALRRFQAKFGLPVVGVAGPRTVARLRELTRDGAAIDPRCLQPGKVICVDKAHRILRAMESGRVLRSMDVRFGSVEMPTREGAFTVYRKSRDHVSSIYHTPMPFALFFDRGEAVHFSRDFAARGYAGNSHGCVNVRSTESVSWLFDWAPIGTPVVVYRSA